MSKVPEFKALNTFHNIMGMLYRGELSDYLDTLEPDTFYELVKCCIENINDDIGSI